MPPDKKKLLTLNLTLAGLLALFTAASIEPIVGGMIGVIAMVVMLFFHFFRWVIPLYIIGLLIANVKAFETVRRGGEINELLLLFGGTGALIASRISDKTAENKQQVGFFFCASLWITIIYPLCSFILFKAGCPRGQVAPLKFL